MLSMVLPPEISMYYLFCLSMELLRPITVLWCWAARTSSVLLTLLSIWLSLYLWLCLHLHFLNPFISPDSAFCLKDPPLSFTRFTFSICKDSLAETLTNVFLKEKKILPKNLQHQLQEILFNLSLFFYSSWPIDKEVIWKFFSGKDE